MKKRGFTLMEMLAVIIILAVVSLITIGIVGGLIEASKKSAFKASAYGMLESANFWYMKNFEDITEEKTVRYPLDAEDSILKVKGKVPDYGKIVITSNGKISLNLYNKELNACAIKSLEEGTIEVRYDYNRYECYMGVSETVDEDVVSDGSITMYLYYPEDSYDRMWRLGSTTGIRSEDTVNEDWQEYMGSVTVPIERASDIWISYKLDSGWVTIPPSGELLVDIKVNTTEKYRESVKVNIDYESGAEKKLYKIGNSAWIPYTGEITISQNTIVQAKVVKTEKLYDSDGNYIGSTKRVSTDRIEIENVKPDALARPVIKRIKTTGSEVARIKINYPSNAVNKYYQINYKGSNVYSGEITFASYGDTVTAYYYDESGKKSKVATMEIVNNEILDSPEITADTVLPSPQVVLTITYPDSAYLKYYKINKGSWKTYTGQIVMTSNETVTAMYKDTNMKESLQDEYDVTNITGGPSNNTNYSIMEKPTITVTPKDNLTEQVTVSVDYPADAEKKYIQIGKNSYKEYTGTFTLNYNTTVRAYYETTEDTSLVAFAKIDNIHFSKYSETESNPNPYVLIRSSPSLSTKTTSDVISLTAVNATEVLYSLDNRTFTPYTGSFTVNNNCTVYALATNSYGEYRTSLKIDNIAGSKTSTSKVMDKYTNVITLTPDLTGTSNKALSVTVTIDFDSRATIKEYRLEGDSSFHTYYGPFKVKENTEVTAVAASGKGYGVATKIVTGLYEGMIRPKIKTSPNANVALGSVEVAITYDTNATTKKYKINNGPWTNYVGTFAVNESATVYAEASNAFETKGASYQINNIVPPATKVITIDKGKYYLIKLNYPTSVTGKEYKYKETGTWKTYKDDGIILVKGEYKDELINGSGLAIKIENENGEYVTFKGDWYLLDLESKLISASIFLRWDYETLYTPTFFVDSQDMESKVLVNVISDRRCTKIEYKKTEPNTSESSTWLTYSSPIEVTKNNTVVKAKCSNASGTVSKEASYKVVNIDSTNPVISSLITTVSTIHTITSSAYADDIESGVDKYEFSINGGEYIDNGINGTYKFENLNEGTSYTIKVRVTNTLGMYSERSYNASTITLAAPTISVNNESVWKPSKIVTLSYPVVQSDKNFIYEYQINGGQWITYVEPFELSENATINARVSVDGIVRSSSKTISYIDSTVPTISLDEVDTYILWNTSVNLPTSYYVNTSLSGGSAECLIGGTKYTNTSSLAVGAYNLNCSVTTGAGVTTTLNKSIEIVTLIPVITNSIYSLMNINDMSTGSYSLTLANATTIEIEYYKITGDTVYTTSPTLCDNVLNTKMCIIRYTGNLTINSGVTLAPQVRKKGMIIIINGTLTNNGTITMTARGANAVGQNVLLYKNNNGTSELVPAAGGAGGGGVTRSSDGCTVGGTGGAGSSRSTGGGGGGTACRWNVATTVSGAGGAGTSYSGGTGGGSVSSRKSGTLRAGAGAANGGAGGYGISSTDNGTLYSAGGGAGNPGGTGYINNAVNSGMSGQTGTAGLLVIYTNSLTNTGSITSNGSTGGNNNNHAAGGSGGGGSVNIFYQGTYSNSGTITANGVGISNGGVGGKGTVTIGSVSTGNFVSN